MNQSASLLAAFVWELRRAFRELATAGDQELRPLGITARDRALLEFLAKEENPISLSDLARKWPVSRQYIHQTLRGLTNPGWVVERPDPSNGRQVLLSLSREGRDFWTGLQVYDSAFFARLAIEFKAEELQAGIAATQKLRKALDQKEKT